MADFTRFTRPPESWDEEMWREALKSVVRFGAEPHEDLEDVVSAGWLLGIRRAELLGRDFWPGLDATYPLVFSVGGHSSLFLQQKLGTTLSQDVGSLYKAYISHVISID